MSHHRLLYAAIEADIEDRILFRRRLRSNEFLNPVPNPPAMPFHIGQMPGKVHNGCNMPHGGLHMRPPNRQRIKSDNKMPKIARLNAKSFIKRTTIPIPTALTPEPPKWKTMLRRAAKSQYNRCLSKVDPRSPEYATIAALLNPIPIHSVEQIVNPMLWEQFTKKRLQMLQLKSDDFELLNNLGLSQPELKTCLYYLRDFTAHPEVAAVPYNDHMSLLFHCTNSKQNIDSICATGLDERICDGGLLGKGIYFADNPKKSMSYDKCGGIIFIFAVLLGDCLSVERKTVKPATEPAKQKDQQRNNNDLFFDSVVGKPGMSGDNEFVIYNRHQSYPLYMIRYGKESENINPAVARAAFFDVNSPRNVHFGINNMRPARAKTDLPPFCWISESGKMPMPSRNRLENIKWPFYAAKQFAKMETDD